LAACVLAVATLASCSSKEFDREGLINFTNVMEGDALRVRASNDGEDLGDNPVPPGATKVRLRFKGANGELKLTFTARRGDTLCTFMLTVKAQGSFELLVDLQTFTCSELPPDAGAPAGPDAQPEVEPDSTPDSGPSPECQKYCSAMRDNCQSVYQTDSECLTACQGFGWHATDPRANDLNCRTAAALSAPAKNDEASCRRAGPHGGNVCGIACRNLCEALDRICPGALPGGSFESCLIAPCDGVTIGPIPSESGATLDCRFHWLTVATTDGRQSCAKLAADGPCR
jgi:hypothetical protein